jgi:integrase
MIAYNEALAASQTLINQPKAGATITLSDCVAAYYKSSTYTGLGSDTTKRNYRRLLDRFCLMVGEDKTTYGSAPADGLRAEHLRLILDPIYAKTPSEAGNLLKRLRAVFRNAVERGLVKQDPTLSVKLRKVKTDGHRAWTDADIDQYRAHWPSGSKPRLALELLIYSGQRRSDVVKMGRQHVRDGAINLRQQKQGKGEVVELSLPIHQNLQAELDQIDPGQMIFVLTEYGKPRSDAGFSGWVSDCAKAAGLPSQSSPHGLRKAAARWLAEAGCSASEIAAITGHASLKDVEHYTKSADQKRLAKAAAARLRGFDSVRDSNPPGDQKENGTVRSL